MHTSLCCASLAPGRARVCQSAASARQRRPGHAPRALGARGARIVRRAHRKTRRSAAFLLGCARASPEKATGRAYGARRPACARRRRQGAPTRACQREGVPARRQGPPARRQCPARAPLGRRLGAVRARVGTPSAPPCAPFFLWWILGWIMSGRELNLHPLVLIHHLQN